MMMSFCNTFDTWNGGTLQGEHYPFVRTVQASSPKAERTEVMGWRTAVTKQFQRLLSLQPGWDGYKAPAIKRENAVFALSMLDAIYSPDIPPPNIVPGSAGDIQIEWHTMEGDVELHVLRPNLVSAWYSRQSDGREIEVELSNNFQSVSSWLVEMMEAERAAEPAAA